MFDNVSSIAGVTRGYAQVEPNHLSAQRTGQIYAQLPVAAKYFTEDRNALENGMFLKYNYADGVADLEGEGEWMLVYNEIKLYREGQDDCEFAMVKGQYSAYVYSPSTGDLSDTAKSRDYTGITAPVDPYSLDATNDPFNIYNQNEVKYLDKATQSSVVPRLFKTNVGDIFTTNAIAEKISDGLHGKTLKVNNNGILAQEGTSDMEWQVVKVYTMPDGQPGVKVMRIK